MLEPQPLRVGVLISGGGTNLQAILDAVREGRLPARVVFVGADNAEAKGLERARACGVPTFVVPYREILARFAEDPPRAFPPPDFSLAAARARQRLRPGAGDPHLDRFLASRAAAEAELLAAMRPYPFDLLVLAGFMRVLTPYFIDRVNAGADPPRIMNIHPALLPAFPGTDGYGDTFRYGCKVAGCTVHFVDYGEDTGPIIGQRAFPIEEGDTLETVRRKGLEHEWRLYPECIRLYAEGRLRTERRVYELPGGRRLERTVVVVAPASPRAAEGGAG